MRNIREEFFSPKTISTDEIDRRLHSRFPCDVPVELFDRQLKKRVKGTAKNVGLGGCYVESANTLAAGTLVEFAMVFEGYVFRCEARVTYSSTCTGVGMGVAFMENNLPDWLAVGS